MIALPRGRRALTRTEVVAAVSTAAIAAFVPLAIEQVFLTSPRPTTWPLALLTGTLAVVGFAIAFQYRQWIRRTGGSLYYVGALPRSSPDRAAGHVEHDLRPRFLDFFPIRTDLPDDPGQWCQTAEHLVQRLRVTSDLDDDQTPNALVLNCEWPVAWYLGVHLTHYWNVDLWERANADHRMAAQRVLQLAHLPGGRSLDRPAVSDAARDDGRPVDAEDAMSAHERPLVHVDDVTSGNVSAATTAAVLLEFTGELHPDEAFLAHAGIDRVIRIRLLGDDGPTIPPTIAPTRFPELVRATADALVEVLSRLQVAYLLARVPPSWPYALGILVSRDANPSPELRFAVHRVKRFIPTDLAIGQPPAVSPVPTPDHAKLVNLTGHPIVIQLDTETLNLAPEVPGARLAVQREDLGSVITDGIAAISVARNTLGQVQDLPAPRDGTLFVTSRLVADAVRRPDVVFPDDVVRDGEGNVVACRALGRVV